MTLSQGDLWCRLLDGNSITRGRFINSTASSTYQSVCECCHFTDNMSVSTCGLEANQYWTHCSPKLHTQITPLWSLRMRICLVVFAQILRYAVDSEVAGLSSEEWLLSSSNDLNLICWWSLFKIYIFMHNKRNNKSSHSYEAGTIEWGDFASKNKGNLRWDEQLWSKIHNLCIWWPEQKAQQSNIFPPKLLQKWLLTIAASHKSICQLWPGFDNYMAVLQWNLSNLEY